MKKLTAIIVFGLVGISNIALALPYDTITKTYLLSGSSTTVIQGSTTPKTVLSVSFLQGNVASDTDLMCGSTVIYRNFATNVSQQDMNYTCQDELKFVKTGADTAQVVINYVTRLRNVEHADPYSNDQWVLMNEMVKIVLFISALIFMVAVSGWVVLSLKR